MTVPSYIQWFIKSSEEFKTKDGKPVEVWEFRHNNDETILKEWAWCFRQNYLTDTELEELTVETDYEGRKSDYLREKIFPDECMLYKNRPPQDSIVRIGDFTELMVSDFFQFCYEKQFWIPRTRYDAKDNRNLSTKGTDIIGFRFEDSSMKNKKDCLLTVEVKANLGKTKDKNKLLAAIIDAQKDPARCAESLAVMSKRFFREHKSKEFVKVKRFQSRVDNPFTQLHSASAVFSDHNFDREVIEEIDTSTDRLNLKLIVFHGDDLMNLCQKLYERAINEA